MKHSRKTTWAGTAIGLAALGEILTRDEFDLRRDIFQAVIAFAAIGFGLVARDDDVSSEGLTAPKDAPEPKKIILEPASPAGADIPKPHEVPATPPVPVVIVPGPEGQG